MSEPAVGRVTVVVLAGSRPGEELRETLGESRCEALVALQLARALAWASECLPAATVARSPGGFTELIGGPSSLGEGDTGAIEEGDMLVAVAPELARWRADLARAAVDDLRAGCALSIGPIFDGGLYLLAATAAGLALLRDGDRNGGGDGDEVGGGDGADAGAIDLTGPAAMAALVALAERTGIEVGLLRTERGLRSAGDVRARLADPLCDAELRRLLG